MSHKFGKKILTAFTSVAVLLIASPLVFAAEAIPAGESYIKVYFAMAAMIGAGLGHRPRSYRRWRRYW